MSRKVLGLDFGSSQSLVSELEIGTDKRPSILKLEGGREACRTLLSFDSNDHTLRAAGNKVLLSRKKRANRDDFYVVRNFKRYLGGKMPDSGVGKQTCNAQDYCRCFLNYLAAQVRKCYNVTELSEEDYSTCVGHPSSWNDGQVKLLRKLVQEAGFPDVQMLPEPIAAVFAMAPRDGAGFADRSENYLVVDFGGGTLDVCIVETGILGRFPRILSCSGDPELGGNEFDLLIRKLYEQNANFRYREQSDYNKAYIDEECEAAKINFSNNFAKGNDVCVSIFNTPNSHKLTLNRKEFLYDCKAEHIVEKFVACLRRAIEGTDLPCSKIDKVILTGGSSLWWFLNDVIVDEFGIDKSRIVVTETPQEDVCCGCANFAGRSQDKELQPGIWVKFREGEYKDETEGWSTLKQILAPEKRGEAATREESREEERQRSTQAFLTELRKSATYTFEFKWYIGVSESTAVEATDEHGQPLDSGIARIRANSNELPNRFANAIRVLAGRKPIQIEDRYHLYIKIQQTGIENKYTMELLDDKAITYRNALKDYSEVDVKDMEKGKHAEIEIRPGFISESSVFSPLTYEMKRKK